VKLFSDFGQIEKTADPRSKRLTEEGDHAPTEVDA